MNRQDDKKIMSITFWRQIQMYTHISLVQHRPVQSLTDPVASAPLQPAWNLLPRLPMFLAAAGSSSQREWQQALGPPWFLRTTDVPRYQSENHRLGESAHQVQVEERGVLSPRSQIRMTVLGNCRSAVYGLPPRRCLVAPVQQNPLFGQLKLSFLLNPSFPVPVISEATRALTCAAWNESSGILNTLTHNRLI